MEDLLQCPICCINYDNATRTPRQLPCQHNLCSQCLPHMRKANANQSPCIECPICREKFFRDLNDIPKSLVIVQLIDAKLGTSHSANSTSSSNTNNNQIPPRPSPPSNNNNNPNSSGTNHNWGQTRQSPYYQPNNYPPPPAPQLPAPMQFPSNYQPPPPPPPYYPNPNGYNAAPMYQSSLPPSNYYNPPPPPPPPQKYQPSQPPQSNNRNQSSNRQWNFRDYLRGIFNEIDVNRDGSITANELQSALRRCQSTQFDMRTIELLISKYDTNMDREISFDEFYDLFNNLNEEYETFLLTDSDGSGFIDLNEFTEALKNKGYFFSRSFYEFIVNKICKRTKTSGIQFDIYIRVAARFDQLCGQYNRTLFYQKNSLENYLRENFFDDFW